MSMASDEWDQNSELLWMDLGYVDGGVYGKIMAEPCYPLDQSVTTMASYCMNG